MSGINRQPEGIKPGIYYDLPADIYHADPALSSSGLKLLLKNPLYYWDSSPLNPHRKQKDTISMKIGRAIHTMLLEPDKFDKEFIVLPPVNDIKIDSEVWGKLSLTEDAADFKLPKKTAKVVKYAGKKIVISEDKFNDIATAVDTVKNDLSIAGLISGGHPEVSIFWRDQETGIMCRVRFDYLRPGWDFDLKSTTNSSMEHIGFAISDYRYDISCAMYAEGRSVAGLKEDNHRGSVLLFLEKESPYLANAVRLSDDIMSKGFNDFRLWKYRKTIRRSP